MNHKDRLAIALDRKTPDRVPVVYFGFGAETTVLNKLGITWKELQENGRMIGKVMLKAHQLWDFDNVNTFLNAEMGIDAFVRDERLRCPFNRNLYSEPLIKSDEDLKRLVFPDFQGKNTMSEVVKAAEYLHESVGNNVALIGGFGGISTWAFILRGAANFFRDYKHNLDLQNRYLKVLTEVAIDYSKAQMAAGCDYIMTMEDLFAVEVMGPKAFDAVGICLERLARAIHEEGGRYILHCCGNCEYSIEEMLKTGADVLSVDRVNLSSFKRRLAGRAAVMGNVKTHDIANKPWKVVEEACIKAITDAKEGGGFLLSSGYICSPQTPEENMLALTRSAKMYGGYSNTEQEKRIESAD